MRIDEIEIRRAEIRELINAEGAEFDADALLEEVRALDTEAAQIREAAAKEAELRSKVDNAVIAEIKENKIEERKVMDIMEIRKSAEYVDAFANYIKTGKDSECRSLLSTIGGGTVPVPVVVDEIVRHAWENEGIMQRVRKTNMRGIVKVGFEKSATGATAHTEGAAAPDEETLVIGTVEISPVSIKKWITISDEALDLAGEAFLRYVYEELTHQIAKAAADMLVAKIVAAPEASSATAVAVAKETANTIGLGTVAAAIAKLSDEAGEPVIIMNKLTYAAFKAVQYAGNYGIDVFEGLTVLFNNSLPAFSAAAAGNTYAIVGDLGRGAMANLPNGDEISIKVDDLSLAEKDLVKFVGREYVGLGIVAPNAFTKIVK